MSRIVILLISVIFFAADSFADMLTVVDTKGVVRSEQALTDNGSIQFNLTDGTDNNPDGVEVLLKNQDTGETLTAFSEKGSVVFPSVAPGTWVVSTTAANVVFTSINIAPAALAGTVGGLGLSSTALTVGGITAVTGATVAIAESNNGSSDVMSPAS